MGGSVREGKYLIKTTTTAEVQGVTAAHWERNEGSPLYYNNKHHATQHESDWQAEPKRLTGTPDGQKCWGLLLSWRIYSMMQITVAQALKNSALSCFFFVFFYYKPPVQFSDLQIWPHWPCGQVEPYLFGGHEGANLMVLCKLAKTYEYICKMNIYSFSCSHQIHIFCIGAILSKLQSPPLLSQ